MNVIDVNKPEIDLIDERGGLQRVARPFPSHVVTGEPPQFLVNQRQQGVKRRRFAAVPRQEERRRTRRGLGNGLILCFPGSKTFTFALERAFTVQL